ncbi:hypothetical protein [Microbacterium sp. NIBRBAC000506063]|nr:hypothetical protein [Microbacterium sp. NIBRBAC000506063]
MDAAGVDHTAPLLEVGPWTLYTGASRSASPRACGWRRSSPSPSSAGSP